MNEFENEPALQPAQQPEVPITPASASLILTPNQEKMLHAIPVGYENAELACDINAGFTIKYGRKLIKFLHTHGIINWVPKGSTPRYKKWFRPQDGQV